MPAWTKRFDHRLAPEPPGTAARLSDVPAKRGVVLLAGVGDQPILLLTAADMRARVRNRLTEAAPEERTRRARLAEVTESVLWKRTHSHFETDLEYFELARRLWPRRYARQVAWKPAWFVHVDPAGETPHFARTREVFAEAGRYFGPFADGRSADRYIEAIQDAFGLCREVTRLRRAPHASPCPYAQMGRCLSVCDGTVPMDQYRDAVAQAADFAAGRREPVVQRLRERMQRAADELAFETAAAIKARLERLAALDAPGCAEAAPAEQFRFIVAQRGAKASRAKTFLVHRGQISASRTLAYPPRADELRKVVERMRRFVRTAPETRKPERYRMGLVAHYLFSGAERRGLIVRWSEHLDADALAEGLRAAAPAMGLRPARRRAKAASDAGSPGAKAEGGE